MRTYGENLRNGKRTGKTIKQHKSGAQADRAADENQPPYLAFSKNQRYNEMMKPSERAVMRRFVFGPDCRTTKAFKLNGEEAP